MTLTTSLIVSVSLTCILLTVITASFSILAYCKVVGMEKSTHRIEWQPMPVPEGKDSIFEEDSGLNPDGMDIGTLAKKMNEMNDEIEDEFM